VLRVLLALAIVALVADEARAAALEHGAAARQTPTLPTAATLRGLVREVDRRHGGRAQVAVTRGGRVVAAASSGPTTRPFRMWSVGKVATAVALLKRGGTLRADVRRAITDALVGSGNCAQRQLMVELQRRAGGIEPARRALARVLRRAGVRHASLAVGAASNRTGCRRYLENASTPGAMGPALQIGIATWRLSDAARFAHALDGLPVAGLLRRAKRHAPDDGVGTGDVTGDLGWGAGIALKDLKPAYKAGWGGLGGSLIYEQVIRVRDVGIAVTFEPRVQPAHDDPYRTGTPQALAQLLRDLRPLLGLR
jgi:hypothetical protein